MNRQQKFDFVSNFRKIVSSYSFLMLVQQRGISVPAIGTFRRALKNKGAVLQVVKNSLAKRALDQRSEKIVPMLKGPTAVIFSSDPVSSCKLAVDFAKNYEGFKLVAAVMEGAIISPKEIEELSKLPSLELMRTKLLAVLMAPGNRFVSVINEVPSALARVLNNYSNNSV